MHQGEPVGTPQPILYPSGRPTVSVVTFLILLQASSLPLSNGNSQPMNPSSCLKQCCHQALASKQPAFPMSTLFTQAFAVVGAFVGGWLARQRRLELESTNRKLRHINTELRRRQHEVGKSTDTKSTLL